MVGRRHMVKKGLVATVEFDVAHFRVHTTMKGRTTYLLPLPTTIIGFFFSILGKSREEYIQDREDFLTGAKILDLKGISRENAQLLKLKQGKEAKTAEEMMILLKPRYRFALWGDGETIDELHNRIDSYDLHFVPYGGISDFIFWDIKDPKVYTQRTMERKIENSYAPSDIVESPDLEVGSLLYSLPYLSHGKPKRVIMAYGTSLNLIREIPAIENIPLYKPPLEMPKNEYKSRRSTD